MEYNDNEYVKLFRKTVNWGWYKDLPTRCLFLHCLIKAHWHDSYFEGYKIGRGSFVTSLSKLADENGMSVKQVRTALNHLKRSGEVAVSVTPKFSIITVLGYDKYQDRDKVEGITRATEGQRRGNRGATYEEIKEFKEYKEPPKPPKGLAASLGPGDPDDAEETMFDGEMTVAEFQRLSPEEQDALYIAHGYE